MLRKVFILATVSTLVIGCATNTVKTPPIIPVDASTLNHELSQQESRLIDMIEKVSVEQQSEIIDLTHAITSLKSSVEHCKPNPQTPSVAVIEDCDANSIIGEKYVLGEVEHVFIDELKASFDTRIDTGAESSSLDARNIILFERDGDDWVRFDVFTLGESGPAQTFESKVERFVRIKQDAQNKSDRRPVIHAHLRIGQYAAETDLNLSNRSHLEYPLLLGRKFMKDIAVVDVSQKFIHGSSSTARFELTQ